MEVAIVKKVKAVDILIRIQRRMKWFCSIFSENENIFYFQTASSSGDPHVHIIKQVKPTDEGLYTCIAGNVLGQATASAYLEVNSARSSLSCSPLLFLLLLLLIAQNKLWINRLTRRQQNLTQSWTYCQDPKKWYKKLKVCFLRSDDTGWDTPLGADKPCSCSNKPARYPYSVRKEALCVCMKMKQ